MHFLFGLSEIVEVDIEVLRAADKVRSRDIPSNTLDALIMTFPELML